MTIIDRIYGVAEGVAIKIPCRVATTANITLAGLQVIDGVSLAADDRVLVKDQTNTVDNGIYAASTGNWLRTKDFNGSYDIVLGTLVYVATGNVGANVMHAVTSTADPIVIGRTAVTFANTLNLDLLGALDISDTTPSTSPITGALTVAGGVGISGDLNVGVPLSSLTNTDFDIWPLSHNFFLQKDSRDSLNFAANIQFLYEYIDTTVSATGDNSGVAGLVGDIDWHRPSLPSTGAGEGFGVLGQVFVRGTGDTTYGDAVGVGGEAFGLAPVNQLTAFRALPWLQSSAVGAYGYLSTFRLFNTGSATNAADFYAAATGNANGVTIANFYSFRADDKSNVGASNTYGFWTNQAAGSNMYAFYGAGTAPSSFGGAITAPSYKVGANQVVGARDTGWTAMTGSPDKATAYATGTVTLAQLAGRVAELQAILTAHGLIGS